MPALEKLWPRIDPVDQGQSTVTLAVGGKFYESWLFRHRRNSWPGQSRDYARTRVKGRAGRWPDFQERRPPAPRADRQGYAAVRLHDRDRLGRGLYLGRHGRAADRSDPDAGSRHADALDARRPGRHEFSPAQPP